VRTLVKNTPSRAEGVTSAKFCLQLAETALRRFNLRVFDPADQQFDFAVGGIRDDLDVIVQVVCVPLDESRTWMIVSASSSSGLQAEGLRNLIREFIVDA
jgi:hypothetical protein